MGFFRVAFACVFFGVSSALSVIARRANRATIATAFLLSILPSTGYSFSSNSVCYYYSSIPVQRGDSGLEYCTAWYLSIDDACEAYKPIFLHFINIQTPGLHAIFVQDSAPNPSYPGCYVTFTRIDELSGALINDSIASDGYRFETTTPPPELKNPGMCVAGAAYSGNPINTGTGNKVQCESDVQWPGFQRCYNSKQNDQLGFKANFGTRWSHSYAQKIISQTTAALLFLRPNGQQLYFSLQAGGSWQGEQDSADRLERLTDSQGGFIGWRYTVAATDDVEFYDAVGKLLSISDRRGFTQTLAYSDGTTGSNGGYALDANGNPTTTILPVGLMIRITDASGRTLNFGYDASSRIVKMIDPAGGIYLYGYDANNNLASVTSPDNHKRIYLYENASFIHALTGIIDTTAGDATGASGTRYASYWYDAQGRAYKEEHAPNLALGIDKHQLTYNTDATTGNPTTTVVTDPLLTSRTYNFQTILGVVKSTGTDQPGGSGCGAASSAMTYDANGNIASRADFNQHKTCFAYDTLGRNLETARVEGLAGAADCATALAATTLTGDARKITTVWDATYRLPHIITEAVGKPEERVTTLNYDATSGNLLSKEIKDTASNKTRTWAYTYTTATDNTLINLLKSVDGPRTDVADITTYTYYTADDTTATPPKYRRGDLWKITNAAGHITQITAYDGNGRPLTLLDANTNPGTVTTTLTYWPRGWLKSKTVGSKTTTYAYDNVGQLTRVTLPDSSHLDYTYDAAHRLTDITDNLLNRVHYTLDAIGNRVKEETFDSNNTLSAMKARDFDGLNRLWHDIAYFNDPNTPVATQYTYDANGNLTTVTAPANSGTDTTYRTTTFSYDALNRLTYAFDPVNTTVHPTQYGFDGLDQVRSVTDPRSLTTSYTVNALGDATQEASPDSRTTNRTFDEAGNLKSATDASGVQTSYQYDVLNRLVSVTFPATGENIAYIWDTGTGCTYGIGRLCQMTAENSGATTTFVYDDQGNRVKKTRLEAGVSVVTQYGYDGANRLASLINPNGKTQSLVHNTAGRVDTVTATSGTTTTTLAKQISYDGAGQITARTLGNGIRLKASYDLSGQPVTGRFNKPDGDLNGDGVVNIVDVLFAARISGGLMTATPDQLDHGDVAPTGNPNGKIDAVDMMRILRKHEKLENF